MNSFETSYEKYDFWDVPLGRSPLNGFRSSPCGHFLSGTNLESFRGFGPRLFANLFFPYTLSEEFPIYSDLHFNFCSICDLCGIHLISQAKLWKADCVKKKITSNRFLLFFVWPKKFWLYFLQSDCWCSVHHLEASFFHFCVTAKVPI